MIKEERVKLLFRTISNIAGFEIKPDKDFYILTNGKKVKYHIDRDLMLWRIDNEGYYENSILQYHQLLTDDYQLEEIEEPLLTDDEAEFLRNFKFDELAISSLLFLCMYDKKSTFPTAIDLNKINLSFSGLKKGKRYSGKELGL